MPNLFDWVENPPEISATAESMLTFKQQISRHTEVPTGDLDTQRMVQVLPEGNSRYWRQEQAYSKLKTLVLADWSFAAWSVSELHKLCVFLEKLQDRGHRLFIHTQKEGLKPLSLGEITQNVTRPLESCKCDQQAVNQVLAEKYNISSDAVLYLDYMALRQLLTACGYIHPSDEPIESLPSSLLLAVPLQYREPVFPELQRLQTLIIVDTYTSSAQGPRYEQCLLDGPYNTMEVPCKYLDFNWSDMDDPEVFRQIAGIWQSEKVSTEVEELILPCAMTEEAWRLFFECPEAERVKRLRYTPAYNSEGLPESLKLSLPALIELDCTEWEELTEADLSRFIQAAPRLEKLSVTKSDSFRAQKIELDTPFLEHLKVLVLGNCQVLSLAMVSSLIQHARQLEELHAYTCRWLDDKALASNNIQLPVLKKLSLLRSNVTGLHLFKLLQMAPLLEELDIQLCESLMDKDIVGIELPHFQRLKKVRAKRASCSWHMLSKIIEHATCLEVLDLTSCFAFPVGWTGACDTQWTALVELNVSQTFISWPKLQDLLASMPNLEVLDVSGCTNLNVPEISTEVPKLERLRKLIAQKSIVVYNILLQFISLCPALEYLDISCNTFTQCVEPRAVVEETSIKTLEATDTGWRETQLLYLLTRMPFVEEVFLCNAEILHDREDEKDDSEYDELFLPELRLLDFFKATISANTLSVVLKCAFNIRTLDLRSSNGLCEDWSVKGKLVLAELDELNLADSDINGRGLAVLLADVPSLRLLNINNCSRMKDAWQGIARLPGLKILHAHGNTLTAIVLVDILTATPNLHLLSIKAARGVHEGWPKAPDIYLSQLLVLDASGSSLTGRMLYDVVESAQALESLSIPQCNSLAIEWPEDRVMSLPALNTLAVGGETLTGKHLVAMLSCARRLKICAIKNARLITTEWPKGEAISLPSLETFTCVNAALLDEQLFEVLRESPQLSALSLHISAWRYGRVDPIDYPLCSLKTLNLQHYNSWNGSLLHSVLERTPRLEVLVLANCENVPESWPGRLSCELKYLRKIVISGQIPVSMAKDIMRAASNLQSIQFSDELYTEDEIQAIQAIRPGALMIGLPANPDTGGVTYDFEWTDSDSDVLETTTSLQAMHQSVNSVAGDIIVDNEQVTDFGELEVIFFSPVGQAPSMSQYRFAVFDTLAVTENYQQGDVPYTLINKNGLQLTAPPIPVQFCVEDTAQYTTKDEEHFYGKVTLAFGDEWVPLPSLSPDEVITHMHLSGVLPNTIALCYSERDNLYYIKKVVPDGLMYPLTVDFVLRTHASFEKSADLLQHEAELRAFEAKSAVSFAGCASGDDVLDRLEQEQTGACRHRAALFMHQQSKTYSYHQVRYVENHVHAYIEVKETKDSCWVQLDLGGYEADFTMKASNQPDYSAEESAHQSHAAREITRPLNPRFFTWDTKKEDYIEPSQFYQQVLHTQPTGQQFLLRSKSKSDAASIVRALAHQCDKEDVHYFVIDKASDVMTAAPYLRLIPGTNQGELMAGPGGPLYDFLTSDLPNKVLLVNWSNFTDEEIIRCNGLIDTPRLADATTVPETVRIIGVSESNTYSGADFYSRSEVLDVPFTPQAENITTESESHGAVIELYEDNYWQGWLLGRWVIQGETFVFEEGALTKWAKNPTKSHQVALAHMPEKNEALLQFCLRLQQNKTFVAGGQQYQLPEDFELIVLDDLSYHLERYLPEEKPEPKAGDVILSLSPGNFAAFLQAVRTEDNQLFCEPGLLAQYKDSTVTLYITSAISESQWARLLCVAKENNVRLNISGPCTKLPAAVKDKLPRVDAELKTPIAFIYTNNCDVLAEIKRDGSDVNVEIIDVSELNSSDLFVGFEGGYQKALHRFKFATHQRVVAKALIEGKTVILKGEFSTALRDYLAALQVNWPEQYRGKLVCMSESEEDFSLMPGFSLEEIALQESLRPFPREIALKLDDDNMSLAACQAFEAARVQLLQDALQDEPYVYIGGATGTGKSSFIHRVFREHCALTIGIENVLAWVENTAGDEDKVLFIDEANITDRQWSEFEGLFNRPPTIIIKGESYPLTDKHKVIFAGNPFSYGGQRTMPRFFKRHHNALLFKSLPKAYLHQKILLPLWQARGVDNSEAESLSILLINVYEYVRTLPNADDLITPRELQAIALQAICYGGSVKEIIARIITSLLPDSIHERFLNWLAQAPEYRLPRRVTPPCYYDNFTNYKKAVHQLRAMLAVRDVKRQAVVPVLKDAPGLNGLLLEGPPAVGKSHFMMSTLLEMGFSAKDPLEPHVDTGNIFYHLSQRMTEQEKTKALLKAFHEGAVVVVDEVNSSSHFEALLNALLMGYDLEGNAAVTPGFTLLATQNPIHMPGRRPMSPALRRRFIKETISPYDQEGLAQIAMLSAAQGLSQQQADDLADDLLAAKAFATKHQLSPSPTLRRLVEVAKESRPKNVAMKGRRIGWVGYRQALGRRHEASCREKPHALRLVN